MWNRDQIRVRWNRVTDRIEAYTPDGHVVSFPEGHQPNLWEIRNEFIWTLARVPVPEPSEGG